MFNVLKNLWEDTWEKRVNRITSLDWEPAHPQSYNSDEEKLKTHVAQDPSVVVVNVYIHGSYEEFDEDTLRQVLSILLS